MEPFQPILDVLKHEQIKYELNYPLAKCSSFKVGGPAKLYVAPSSFYEFKILQKAIRENNVPFFFLGGGSNLLISDKGFDGVVIRMMSPEKVIIKKKTNQILWVRGLANTRSAWFAKIVSKMGYQGLEFLSTVPGSLGGAITQNAGCYGFEIKDSIEKIFASINGSTKILKKEEANFSYRNSLFKKNNQVWVYAVEFKLQSGKPHKIQAKLEEYKHHRLTSQPKNKKSAGSIFKNPDKNTSHLKAWELIERVNFRGKRIGGAVFSKEHSNFIVNEKNAKASNIHKLISLAQKEVKEEMGIELETEIVRLGNFE